MAGKEHHPHKSHSQELVPGRDEVKECCCKIKWDSFFSPCISAETCSPWIISYFFETNRERFENKY